MINWYIKGKTLCRPILLLIIIAIRESQSPVARSSDFANPPYNEIKIYFVLNAFHIEAFSISYM